MTRKSTHPILLVIVAFSVLSTTLSTGFKLEGEISKAISFKKYNNKIYPTLSLLVGQLASNKSQGFPVPMIPDMSEQSIFVGDKTILNWGIVCDSESSCQSGTSTTCARSEMPDIKATCKEATTMIRYENITLPKDYPSIKISILESSDNWLPKSVGILGLAPDSNFWDYLKSSIENGKDYVEVSLFYRATDPENIQEQSEANYKNAMITFNGNSIAANKPTYIQVASTPEKPFWVLSDTTFNYGGENSKDQTGKLCISNTMNATLIVPNLADFKTAFFTQLCGNAKSCERTKSLTQKIDNVKINIANGTDSGVNSQISFLPEELYYFDKDNKAQLLVKEVSDPSLQFQAVCGKEATYGLGLTAFAKRELAIRYHGSGKFEIGIQIFEPTYLYLIILLVLASILLVLFVIACLFTLIMRCREEKSVDISGAGSTLGDKRQKLIEGTFNTNSVAIN